MDEEKEVNTLRDAEHALGEEVHRPQGTLACLAAGFEVVARNPGLILLPLLLDLFLWLGPRLSLAAVIQDLLLFSETWLLSELTQPEALQNYALLEEMLLQFRDGFNLFTALYPAPLFGVPVLMPLRMTSLWPPPGPRPTLEIGSLLLALVIALGLMLLGLVLNALYMRRVGRQVLEETETAIEIPGPASFLTIWTRLVILASVGGSIVMGLGMGLLFFATLVALVSEFLAMLILLFALSAALFIGVHLLFTIPGIVQFRRGLLRAMRDSLILVRADFLNVTLLILLILLLSRGLNVAWKLPNPDSWTQLVGLAGHAVISTALTGGFFVFYQERLAFIRTLEKALAAKDPKARTLIGE